MSLRRLGQDALDLFQLHRIDPNVNPDDQFGLLRTLVDEGKVKAVGLSEVSVDQVKAARAVVEISSVQNMYNLTSRKSEDVLEYCEREGIGFIQVSGGVRRARSHRGTPRQVVAPNSVSGRPVITRVAPTAIARRIANSRNVPGRSSRRELRGR